MTRLLRDGDIASMTALINSQANAMLIKLERSGGVDRSGDPTGYVQVWSGEAPALLERREVDIPAKGEQALADVQHVDTLTVLDGTAPIVDEVGHDWDGWRITISDQRENVPVEREFSVTGVRRDAYHLLDSMTLTLGA